MSSGIVACPGQCYTWPYDIIMHEIQMVTTIVPTDWPVSKYIEALRQHRRALNERYRIESLGIFGSYVRNEQREGSDLDVLVTFSQTPSLFTLVALQDELSALLSVPVDVVLKTSLKPRIGQHILREVIEV